MLKARGMKWARYVAHMERKRTADTALIGEIEKTTYKT
jgi:hypothetical protein